MSIDIDGAASFLAAHARVLDRRRFALLTEGATDQDRRAVLAALEGYRNGDGGFGWGIEPDLRAPESQPAGALHALEVIAEVGPMTTPATSELLDWLDSVTLPDGGLPFALAVADPTACAPFWARADPGASSLQITAAVAAQAHRVGRFDTEVRKHPWTVRATRYCLDEISRIEEAPFAYVLSFALGFLGAVCDIHPGAIGQRERLARFVPPDGVVAVRGGAEGESLHLLDLAPLPDDPVRGLLDDVAVARDLDRLERGQCSDGGWAVDFSTHSEAAVLEWRGYATVSAVAVLGANGR